MNWLGWSDATWITLGYVAGCLLLVALIIIFITWRVYRKDKRHTDLIDLIDGRIDRASGSRAYRLQRIDKDIWEIKKKLDMLKPQDRGCG